MKNFIKFILSVFHVSPRPGDVSSLGSNPVHVPYAPYVTEEELGYIFEPYKGKWYDNDIEDNVYYNFKPGEKVILFGNEPKPYQFGEFMGIDDTFKKFPIIKVYEDKMYMCMGIILPYRRHYVKVLDSLLPIEQWNYFVHPRARISEKYGKKYRTEFNDIY